MGAKRGRDPLLIEVLASIGEGRISEDLIRDAKGGFVVMGLEQGGHVTINPAASVVEILIHELVHRLRPAWSERTVKGRAVRLRRLLSDAEIDRLYEVYQRVAVKVKRRGRRSA